MKRNLLLPVISALLLGAAVLPARASNCPGFLPHNDLKIPVGSAQDKGMLEAQFNEVLNTLEKIYKPQLAALGKVLQINRLWTNNTVNASTSQSGNRVILNMYGGLARHEAVTMDGFALVVCHELGHNLGGAPKGGWASIEGQSDYYANLKCLRQVFADSSASAFTRSLQGDEVAEQGCAALYSDPQESAICLRGSMAGKSVSNLFKVLHNDPVAPSFATPDPKVVTAMFTSHPATQCRMDTYLAGSLCTQPVSAPLSNTNPAAGTCTRSAGFQAGFRPLCWYKPANAAELLPPAAKAFEVTEQLSPSLDALKTGYWPGLRAPLAW
ncbi:MAG: hypothetical protein A2X35_01605 [Elusimicrobia bacterium GWA2_61_42]|nr:MAG: hypothetical protein A2X35_01605 [Elusimicrobia bacterium GWA2_61_42]OGR76842.1 MAG: hypothetical protein A2X38_11780 [Elusimicrobia bacterium GWC2_61_25]